MAAVSGRASGRWRQLGRVAFALGVAAALAALALGAAGLASRGAHAILSEHPVGAEERWRWVALARLSGLYVTLVVLVPAASLLAWRGSGGVLRRLGLGPGGPPLGRSLVWAIGSLFPVYAAGVAIELLAEAPSSALRGSEELMASTEGGVLLTLALILVVAVGAASGEELLFRGWLLRSLERELAPGWAIAIVTCLFAAAHTDPQHALAVLPASLWWTLLTWRTGSIWPAWLGHLLVNLVGGCLTAWAGVRLGAMPSWVHALAWTAAFPAFAVGLSWLPLARARSDAPGGA